MKNQIVSELNSTILMLKAHPDNKLNSEFEDRVISLQDLLKNDFREVSEFELLKLNFEKYKDDYGRVKFRRFSWSIIQRYCGDFYYEWIGGNTKIKSMEHLNSLYFNMTGEYLF